MREINTQIPCTIWGNDFYQLKPNYVYIAQTIRLMIFKWKNSYQNIDHWNSEVHPLELFSKKLTALQVSDPAVNDVVDFKSN